MVVKVNCQKCIWGDICDSQPPCDDYTPADYEEVIAEKEEQRIRRMYYDELLEEAWCSEDEDIFSPQE